MIDHLSRREAGKMVSVLTRILGFPKCKLIFNKNLHTWGDYTYESLDNIAIAEATVHNCESFFETFTISALVDLFSINK